MASHREHSPFPERMRVKTPADHHGDLMLRLRNEIGSHNYRVIKHALLASKKLTEVQAEKVGDDFSALWNTLSSNNVISIGLYTTLKEILSGMNLHSLVQMIEQVEQTIEEWMASVMPVEKGDHLTDEKMFSFNSASFRPTSQNTSARYASSVFDGKAKSVYELGAQLGALRLEPRKLGNLCSSCSADGTYSWAASSCDDCDVFLCWACGDQHRAKRHNIQLIATSALEQEAKERLCEESEHGNLDSFCQDCDVLFCTKCCLKTHSEHRCCTFHEAVAAISKDILEAQKTGEKVSAKLSSRKRKAESMQEIRRVNAEALKQEIEQSAATLIQSILEKKNHLLQEIKTYVRNEELADAVSASYGAKQRLDASMQLCGQMLSTSVRSPEKVKVLKNTLEQVKKASVITDKARCREVEPLFPRFIDCAGHMKALGLGFLKPFSRAVKFENFNVTISSPCCFVYSVAILPDGSCAALGASTPDSAAPRALFVYSKDGRSQHVIKAGVGLAVDMICHNGELVVLRKHKPYVKFFTPVGVFKSYDIGGDLANPWSIGIDMVGRIIITHGTACERLALVYQRNPKRMTRPFPARDALQGSEMDRPPPEGSKEISVDRVKEQEPNSMPLPLTSAVMNPDAGKCLGPGRLSCEREIYCAFDREIVRYTVNGAEIVQTRSGEHDIKDFTIHAVKVRGEVFVIGEWWEEVRVYEVSEPSDGREGWDLKRIPLIGSDGEVGLVGRSGICFDIKDNVMLIGYTDADDRGHMAMFRLGPV